MASNTDLVDDYAFSLSKLIEIEVKYITQIENIATVPDSPSAFDAAEFLSLERKSIETRSSQADIESELNNCWE